MDDFKVLIGDDEESVTKDFMYSNNVASSQIYIRMGFLRKVYGILSAQLLLTTIIAASLMFTPTIRFYISENQWIMTAMFLSSIVLLLALMVKGRETPINYVLLTAFTAVEAFTVGVFVTFYDQMSVLQAFVMTVSVTICLTLFTLQSKRDFSSWRAGLFSVLWVFIIAGFLQIFVQSTHLELFMAIGGSILFSLFIVYDTHMIMNKHSPEEYIMASVSLYLDILNLFLHILRLVGRRQ